MFLSKFGRRTEVYRVSPVCVPPPILIERVSAKASELGYPLPSVELLTDAYSFLAQGKAISREQLSEMLRLKYRYEIPWFARPVSEIIRACFPSILARNENILAAFRCLTPDMIPGSNSEQQVLSVVALCHFASSALDRTEYSLAELFETIREIVQLPRELTADERSLFECFPPLTAVEELPEDLMKQFVESGTQPEYFFLGELLPIERALGEAVAKTKRMRWERKKANVEVVKDFPTRELLELEQLLMERGKLILLRTYHLVKSYRSFSQIRVKRFRLHPDGREIRSRRMKSLSEMHRVRQTDLLLLAQHPTLFWLQMLQHHGTVRERGVRSVTKRLVYLLIDRSLSMLFHGSMFKAGGVLFARLLAVLRDDAILRLRFFDGNVHSPIEARDPADSQAVMGMIRRTNFIGSGGTNINEALRTGIQDIRKLCATENVERPQLLIVTDGKGEVTVTPQEFGEIELHAFICHNRNPSLKELANSLGGIALEQL